MESIKKEDLENLKKLRLADIDAYADFVKIRAEFERFVQKLCVNYSLKNSEQIQNDGTIKRDD